MSDLKDIVQAGELPLRLEVEEVLPDVLEANRIYKADCLEGIKKVPTGTVALIIADPPYFMGMTHNGQRGSFVDLANLKPFYKELFREFRRILAADGQVYFFTDWRGHAFYYPLMEAWLGVRNCIVWDKMAGPGTDYQYCHEFILWYAPNHVKRSGSNVWRSKGFSAGAKVTNGEKVQETQKTLEIIGKIVRENSLPGQLVLDPFAGSGTTAVVCRQLERQYICFELDESNHHQAEQRAKHAPQGSGFNGKEQ